MKPIGNKKMRDKSKKNLFTPRDPFSGKRSNRVASFENVSPISYIPGSKAPKKSL